VNPNDYQMITNIAKRKTLEFLQYVSWLTITTSNQLQSLISIQSKSQEITKHHFKLSPYDLTPVEKSQISKKSQIINS
jgi:hypothetical protein